MVAFFLRCLDKGSEEKEDLFPGICNVHLVDWQWVSVSSLRARPLSHSSFNPQCLFQVILVKSKKQACLNADYMPIITARTKSKSKTWALPLRLSLG